MEQEYQLLTLLWFVTEVQLVTQTVQTPNGPMQMQQQVQVPKFFRNVKEVTRFIETAEADQVVLARQWVDKDANLSWYYGDK
jgi:hypothetical protein